MAVVKPWLPGAAFLVAGVLAGLTCAQPGPGSEAKADGSRRYEVLLTGAEGRHFVLVGVTTGHCWERSVVQDGEFAVSRRSEWTDLGEPPFKPAAP